MQYRYTWMFLLFSTVIVGCNDPAGYLSDPADYIKPTIAVIRFDNRASVQTQWSLGDGFQSVLVDRLVDSERFVVLERPELGAIVSEQQLQASGLTRTQRQAKLRNLKNAQYLVKGSITEFSVTQGGSAYANWNDWWRMLGVGASGSAEKAIVGVTLNVVDVESGEIVDSAALEGSAYATAFSAQVDYKKINFGGTAFYRTRMGRAVKDVLEDGVKHVVRVIASQPWRPKIATLEPDGTVLINGGTNRKLTPGMLFEVYQLGDPIMDPDTGDILGRRARTVLATVEIIDVQPKFAGAKLLTGKQSLLEEGQLCSPYKPVKK